METEHLLLSPFQLLGANDVLENLTSDPLGIAALF